MPDGTPGVAVKYEAALVIFMDRRYLDGFQAEFERKGDRKLARSDRCLKGWKMVAPTLGRDPMPEEV